MALEYSVTNLLLKRNEWESHAVRAARLTFQKISMKIDCSLSYYHFSYYIQIAEKCHNALYNYPSKCLAFWYTASSVIQDNEKVSIDQSRLRLKRDWSFIIFLISTWTNIIAICTMPISPFTGRKAVFFSATIVSVGVACINACVTTYVGYVICRFILNGTLTVSFYLHSFEPCHPLYKQIFKSLPLSYRAKFSFSVTSTIELCSVVFTNNIW